jgi:hypothetical protein
VFRPEPNEAGESTLLRFEGVTVKTGKVLGLEARGWRRGPAQDAGWIWAMVKPLTDNLEASLDLEGGILAGDMSESPSEQKLKSITLVKRGKSGGTVALGEIPALLFSELVRDIAELSAS